MADSKISGFLSKDTAGLPNWAWILVVGAGIAAVYILPKFFPGTSSNASSSTGATDTSGLGLAVDPTTGLPYAVEGMVPSGGTITSTGNLPPPPPSITGTTVTTGVGGSLSPPQFLGPPQQKPPPTPAPAPAPASNQITIGQTPGFPNGSTIAAYAKVIGQPYATICQLNPWLKCGAGYSNGEYDWNNPGNVNGKIFITGGAGGGGPAFSPQVAPTSPTWPGGTTQMRVGG